MGEELKLRRGLAHPTPYSDVDFEGVRDGRLYFYIGSGLSALSGMISWGQMIRCIQKLREELEGAIVKPTGTSALDYCRYMDEWLRERVNPADPDSAPILSRTSGDPRTFRRVVLLNIMFRYARGGSIIPCQPNPEAQRRLWCVNCDGAITTNYDTLLEQAYTAQSKPVNFASDLDAAHLRSYRYNAEFLEFLFSNPVFLLKAHGDINDLGTMVLDPDRAWQAGGELGGESGALLKEVYKRARCFGHFVFIGAGMRDRTVLELQKAWRSSGISSSGFRCLALIPHIEIRGIAEELEAVARKYSVRASLFDDIEFVTYNQEGYRGRAVLDFLVKLARLRRSPGPTTPKHGWRAQQRLYREASKVSDLFIHLTEQST